MTQKEFEDRTGLKTTAEEWAAIEKMYMVAGEMNKDEFCVRWRQTGQNPLTKTLAKTAESLNGLLETRNKEIKDMQVKNTELARFLLGKALAYEDPDFRNEAIRLIGEREVIRLTLEEGYPLCEEDRKYLTSILERKQG